MPGRLFLTTPPGDIARGLGLAAPEFDEPPRRNIAPGQQVVAIAPGPVLTRMRWGMIPVGRVDARGRPVMETIVNARSETVFDKTAFAGVGRCAVPADGWYEWTGEKRRKTAWRIRRADGGLLFFAAISDVWTAPGGRALWQLATVTCAPSDDVAAVHHRMGAILAPGEIEPWLTGGAEAAAALLRPLAAGSLIVEPADDVDWTAP